MKYTFSPTSLSLLKDCERCFWLQFNREIKRPEGIFPSLPSGMDRILKSHFDRFRDKGTLPPELKNLKGVSLFGDKELLETWRNNRKGIRFTDEHGNVLRGAVDNVLKKDGKLIVLDYKTRGYPVKEDTAAHYQDQLDIYTFLLQKNAYATEDHAYLLFYHPDKVLDSGEVVFHSDLVTMKVNPKNAEKILTRALGVLKGPMPKANDCAYCSWARTTH